MSETPNGRSVDQDGHSPSPRSSKKQGKPARAKQKRKAPPKPSSNGHVATPARKPLGRLLESVEILSVEWLLKPWFARGELSFIAGVPAVGKSTMAAWLIAQAGRTILFPGYEENAERATAPRLIANGVHPDLVKLMDDEEYIFPDDVKRTVVAARDFGSRLIVLDPVDSYMRDSVWEGDTHGVRTFLESLSELAHESGAAVVCVRHPGKDLTNIMPGSRQWRAVPRSIVELTSDGKRTPEYFLKHYKNSFGKRSKPFSYTLEGDGEVPSRFVLGKPLEASQEELADLANDSFLKRNVRHVCNLIKHLFDEQEEPSVNELTSLCRAQGIGDRPRSEALHVLHIEVRAAGKGSPWKMYRTLPDWPDWLLKDSQ